MHIGRVFREIVGAVLSVAMLSNATAQYSGGTGEPNDPYLLYTAEHLNALGAEPNDYGKHFKLMADIDLSGYSYDQAVIAPDADPCDPVFRGPSFAGVFDGNGHVLSQLTITGQDYPRLWWEAISAGPTDFKGDLILQGENDEQKRHYHQDVADHYYSVPREHGRGSRPSGDV